MTTKGRKINFRNESPGNESSQERMFPIGTIRSWERKVWSTFMLKADRKTAQTIGPHCVWSTAVGCVVKFSLWTLGTRYGDCTT